MQNLNASTRAHLVKLSQYFFMSRNGYFYCRGYLVKGLTSILGSAIFTVFPAVLFIFTRQKFLILGTGAGPGFGQGGGPQLLRPKVADIAKRSRASEASILRPGSRARLRALEAFGFLMLKYAFSHILETLFLLFLTSILTPKVDKNRALDFTSINLRHSDMLHLFFNLHEKVML